MKKMKKINKLKLNQLSKDSLESSQMNQIRGGTFCYWSEDNFKANEYSGKCSCACGLLSEGDYYDADGLNYQAGYLAYD